MLRDCWYGKRPAAQWTVEPLTHLLSNSYSNWGGWIRTTDLLINSQISDHSLTIPHDAETAVSLASSCLFPFRIIPLDSCQRDC